MNAAAPSLRASSLQVILAAKGQGLTFTFHKVWQLT